MGRDADLQRIDPDRLGDVFELGRAEIVDREIETPLHLPVGLLGKTDRAWLGDALQPRGDVDTVAHQVAVALLDDVAKVDADAELDATLRRKAAVALDHAVLHFDCTTHGVDHAAELDEAAVARALDDAPLMHGDGGIDQIATEAPQARQGAILVRRGELDCSRQRRRPGLQRACAFPPWRTLCASLRVARNPIAVFTHASHRVPPSIAANSA